MSQHVAYVTLLAVVWGFFAIVPCQAEFAFGTVLKNHADAVEYCRTHHSRLVLPQSRQHNSDITTYMKRQGLTQSWIDLKIYQAELHVLGSKQALHDQGCYKETGVSGTEPVTSLSAQQCESHCRPTHALSAFQRLEDKSGNCRCVKSFDIGSGLLGTYCDGACGENGGSICGHQQHSSLRVFNKNGLRDVPEWDLQQTPQTHTIQCLVVYRDAGDPMTHRSLLRPCKDHNKALCKGAVIANKMDWFTAHSACAKRGSHLLSNFHYLSNVTLVTTSYYWTGVVGWNISSSDHKENVTYWEWHGENPDVSSVECVLTSGNKGWEVAKCNTQRPYICESGSENKSTEASTEVSLSSKAESGSVYVSTTVSLTLLSTNRVSSDPVNSTLLDGGRSSANMDTARDTLIAGIASSISIGIAAIIITIVGFLWVRRRKTTQHASAEDSDFAAASLYTVGAITNSNKKISAGKTKDVNHVKNSSEEEIGDKAVYADPNEPKIEAATIIVENQLYEDSPLPVSDAISGDGEVEVEDALYGMSKPEKIDNPAAALCDLTTKQYDKSRACECDLGLADTADVVFDSDIYDTAAPVMDDTSNKA